MICLQKPWKVFNGGKNAFNSNPAKVVPATNWPKILPVAVALIGSHDNTLEYQNESIHHWITEASNHLAVLYIHIWMFCHCWIWPNSSARVQDVIGSMVFLHVICKQQN
jgi:hypothetical protein